MAPIHAKALAVCLAFTAGAALAQPTPTGLWKAVDDETKVETSLVRISDSGGVLSGRVEKVLDPSTPADATCLKCTDERRDAPIQGMTVLRHVKQNAREPGLWDGGDILDPHNGKVYKVRLKPVDGGARLEVRGYIGTPLLGRTQTWVRVE
jgi:uncharacterized protein (DUF2147 family)